LLAVLLVLTTVVSAGYYLPVVMAMYMKPEPSAEAHATVRLGRLSGVVVAAAVAGLLVLGVQPSRVLDLARVSGASVRAPNAAPTPPAPSLSVDGAGADGGGGGVGGGR
jgi:NADH-quinone oxidoreductase subunit N